MGTPSGFDLSSAAAQTSREDEGQVIQVRNLDGSPATVERDGAAVPVTIRVAGSFSAVHREAQDRLRDQFVKSHRTKLSGAALSRQQLELTAACVLAWDGFTDGGTPLACTRDNVLRLLTAAPWVRQQVEEAIEDHASFFGASSSN